MSPIRAPRQQLDLSAQNVARLRRRRKSIRRGIILFCLALIPIISWLELRIFKGSDMGVESNNILIFVLININVLLALLFLFLVLRNLAEVLFEGRARRLGRKLKTKLIASFLLLSLIPTLLLFFVSMQFVTTSMDYWFDDSVEVSLQESLTLARSLLDEKKSQCRELSETTASLLRDLPQKSTQLRRAELRRIIGYSPAGLLDAIRIEPPEGGETLEALSPRLQGSVLPAIPWEILQKLKTELQPQEFTQQIRSGTLVSSAAILQTGDNTKSLVISSTLLDAAQLSHMKGISAGVENYRQLKHFKEPIKFWLIIFLLIVTLMVAFAAIWFGLYISKGLTSPLENLVHATQRVAGGDLEFKIPGASHDEMGRLIDSFNLMTDQLNRSKQELAGTYAALRISSEESEQRRRYTEIVLQNVQAGVISIDQDGGITTINRFAEKLLNIDRDLFLGHNFTEVLPRSQADIVIGFIEELSVTERQTIEKHIRMQVRGEEFSLLINFTRLDSDSGELLGFVLVFDNLTKLEKMQRMAAWREMARRMAHEIKNPLTPIQLSAQRLRKRYPEIIDQEGSILDKCTTTIIDQVEALRVLVGEFSQFSRLPKIDKTPADITEIVRSILDLYEGAHEEIHFTLQLDEIPKFAFDSEQIRRCLINLYDNAVAVLPDGGTITTTLQVETESGNLFLTVGDDGPGIAAKDRAHIFDPYYSTKSGGSGLGLAIVSTIILDHNGTINALPNSPHGTLFVIELPMARNPQPAADNAEDDTYS